MRGVCVLTAFMELFAYLIFLETPLMSYQPECARMTPEALLPFRSGFSVQVPSCPEGRSYLLTKFLASAVIQQCRASLLLAPVPLHQACPAQATGTGLVAPHVPAPPPAGVPRTYGEDYRGSSCNRRSRGWRG